MKIQFFSDIHDSSWDDFKVTGDIIVTAGDIGSVPDIKINVPWIWLDGNHEWYNSYNYIPKYAKYLDCGEIIDVLGQKFIGCTLWSDSIKVKLLNDVKYIDFNKICKWHQLEVAWLWELVKKGITKDAIIVTHNAPSFKSQPDHDSLTSAFCNNLDSLVKESEAKLWIHGHTHIQSDYMIGKTRVVSNQVGYSWENIGFINGRTICI